ncbi:MAG TPA: hypothetical protein VFJ77_09305 [Gaiellaceae bacterium]|nr:hypothetical protein [Gaiellaceae bacterium]
MPPFASLAADRSRLVVCAGLVALQWAAAGWAAHGGHRSGALALVVLQVVLLLPLALLSVVAAGTRLAGRVAGLVAGGVWVVLPLLAYGYLDGRARPSAHDVLLPRILGLADSGVFTAVVALAVALLLLVHALDRAGLRLAGAAGLAAGVACAFSAAAWVFLPGLAAAFALRRRPAALAAALACAAPGLLVGVLWHLHAPGTAVLAHWDPGTVGRNVLAFREYGWSQRVLQWLGVAATVAVLRLRHPAGPAAAIWFWLALLLQGSIMRGSAEAVPSTFLTALLSAFPAFVLMVAALPLLLPRLPVRIAARRGGEPRASHS